MESGKWLRLLIVISVLFFCCQIASGTLIIWAYHDGQCYLASDSLFTGTGKTPDQKIQKVFQISKTGCAAICGDYGTWGSSNTTVVFDFRLPQQLGVLAKRTCDEGVPISEAVQRIVDGFSLFYGVYSNWFEKVKYPVSADGTGLLCCGYKPEQKLFFCSYGSFGKKPLPFKPAFEGTDGQEGTFLFLGASHFSSDLIAPIMRDTGLPDDRYKTLRQPGLVTFVRSIKSTKDKVSDSDVTKYFQLIFELHKCYSPELTPDQPGGIDGPYVIYKITTNGVTPLN